MKVIKHSVNSPRIFEKVKRYESILLDRLSMFFQTKDYGEGVYEIIYIEILVPGEVPDDGSPKIIYVQEKKSISCIIQPDYKKANGISLNKFGNFIASYYLEMSNKFIELNIDEFNGKEYVEDLKDFFKTNKLI